VDMQAMDNAVNNVKREILSRYDFKNVKSEVTLDRKEKRIHIVSGDDSKVKAVTDMLIGHCVRLKVDPRGLELKKLFVALSQRNCIVSSSFKFTGLEINASTPDSKVLIL